MGELLGIPDWLAKTLWLILFLAAFLGLGFFLLRRARKRLAAKRPNPTRDDFMSWMRDDVSAATAAWMWDTLQLYYKPLTPHPDDFLIDDAKIDEDDIGMDWPRDFEEHLGLGKIDWPQWPKEWDLTVRNYARWLELGFENSSGPA